MLGRIRRDFGCSGFRLFGLKYGWMRLPGGSQWQFWIRNGDVDYMAWSLGCGYLLHVLCLRLLLGFSWAKSTLGGEMSQEMLQRLVRLDGLIANKQN